MGKTKLRQEVLRVKLLRGTEGRGEITRIGSEPLPELLHPLGHLDDPAWPF